MNHTKRHNDSKKNGHIGLNICSLLLCASSLFAANVQAHTNQYSYEKNERVSVSNILGDWHIKLIERKGILFYVPRESENTQIQINNNQITGTAGCNHFMAGYIPRSNTQIDISHGAATKKMCSPKVMQFEDIFLQIFTGLFTVEPSFDGVVLVHDDTKVYLVR
ncbi:META domain-containing protein [Helicobacter aurati]|uniref:META domain-containing protein n=1 Tax=Helicobacter aurati TaxID=137778 RepID=A0A3D8J7E8_9HELI|nr:META domain-containing protein [Helicobacter aurati]RDU73348.1 META domain-containing protein [Helicobacter aurati]